jgi:hypothetical protein
MEKETTAAPVMSQIRRETQLIASYAKKDGSHLRAGSAINVKLARFHPNKRMLVSSVHLDSTLTRVHRHVTVVRKDSFAQKRHSGSAHQEKSLTRATRSLYHAILANPVSLAKMVNRAGNVRQALSAMSEELAALSAPSELTPRKERKYAMSAQLGTTVQTQAG